MGKVLHASESGYFTKCINEASSPDHCPWTLEQAMASYWRVRTWKFEASGLGAESGETPNIPFSTTIDNIASGDDNITTASNSPIGYYTSEEQLVCFNEFFVILPDERISFIGFGNPEKSGSLYTNGIYGTLKDEGDGRSNFRYEFRVYPIYTTNEPPPQNNSGIITVLGATLPLLVYEFDAEVSSTFADVVATLTPTLWWSYGGTYDTATGAPL